MTFNTELKEQLLKQLNDLLDERIGASLKAIESAKEARDNDTKSSAGDKYETGRAMMQMELDKHQAQLSKNRALKNELSKINPSVAMQEAAFGSLLVCNQGHYLLSVAMGKIRIGQTDVYCLSMLSPLGQALRGKKAGDELDFNGQLIQVKSIV
ncbi:hypothetical protein [uncultured Sunxiuqinia sp.]|uniref:hypothetical protein n=1 Tax=uncultured Sunxiuqinia sp. TaxID=1573825 RepID=UPI0026356ED9|nr:hypothetical protein [uncultured Sunxiuqinia sp.]